MPPLGVIGCYGDPTLGPTQKIQLMVSLVHLAHYLTDAGKWHNALEINVGIPNNGIL